MTSLLNIVLGGSLLLGGRKVFWLLLGAIGFVTGVEVSTRFIHRSELVTIGAAIALGVVFALLAIFLESVAIGLAGFLGGGYVALSLASLLGLQGRNVELVAFILGGILGVLLIVALFDWALISISSLAGASMVVSALGLAPWNQGDRVRRLGAPRRAHPRAGASPGSADPTRARSLVPDYRSPGNPARRPRLRAIHTPRISYSQAREFVAVHLGAGAVALWRIRIIPITISNLKHASQEDLNGD